MVNLLVGIHATLGELSILAFLWVFVELFNPTDQRIKRAKIAAVVGTLMIFASWLAGGYYYVNFYGSSVKPITKEGPMPWAHGIFMETKEHVFLFLPFLSLLATSMIYSYQHVLSKDNKAKIAILLLLGLVVLLGLSMAGMGYIVSTGARAGLEAKLV